MKQEKTRPKITFLMVAYNAEKTIDKAVRSILNQTERDITLRVRNNGSTDKTGAILQDLAHQDSRVKVYHNHVNGYDDDDGFFSRDGVLRWWPLDSQEELGAYISIVDSDDWLAPTFATELYTAAQKVQADIAVCGNTFMLDGHIKSGDRLPPQIMTHQLKAESKTICNVFPPLYNAFRTWWAKLYRRDFFLKHYDLCWKVVGGNNGGILDTLTMLRYLQRCSGFASIPKPLYLSYVAAQTTYNTRSPSFLRAMEAEELYEESLHFLKTFSAETTQNIQFVLNLHAAYIKESLECLKIPHPDAPPLKELSWISCLLGNAVLASLYKSGGGKEFVDSCAESYTRLVVERNKGEYQIYLSYLARLHYLKSAFAQGINSFLFYPILLGCLYDPENKYNLGEELLEKLQISPEFVKVAKDMLPYQKWESAQGLLSPLIVYMRIFKNLSTATSSLEKKLELSVEDKQYETAFDLIEQISRENPLNRTAMFTRIQLLYASNEKELACVLAGTARILWNTDIEMQQLCWNIFGNINT